MVSEQSSGQQHRQARRRTEAGVHRQDDSSESGGGGPGDLQAEGVPAIQHERRQGGPRIGRPAVVPQLEQRREARATGRLEHSGPERAEREMGVMAFSQLAHGLACYPVAAALVPSRYPSLRPSLPGRPRRRQRWTRYRRYRRSRL